VPLHPRRTSCSADSRHSSDDGGGVCGGVWMCGGDDVSGGSGGHGVPNTQLGGGVVTLGVGGGRTAVAGHGSRRAGRRQGWWHRQ
jgi:hypothetical protein